MPRGTAKLHRMTRLPPPASATLACLGIASLILSACAQFPAVEGASRPVAGPAPALLPVDALLEAPAPQAEARGAALSARAAALRARAGVP